MKASTPGPRPHGPTPHGPMILEIQFGKDGKNSGEIMVHPGDDPLELAKAFAVQHKIKDKAVPLIQSHIETFLVEMNRSQVATPVSAVPTPTPTPMTAAMTAKERVAARLAAKRAAQSNGAGPHTSGATTDVTGSMKASPDTATATPSALSPTSQADQDAVEDSVINVQMSFGAQSPVEISPIRYTKPGNFQPAHLGGPPTSSPGTELDGSWQAETLQQNTPPIYINKDSTEVGGMTARASVYPYGYPPQPLPQPSSSVHASQVGAAGDEDPHRSKNIQTAGSGSSSPSSSSTRETLGGGKVANKSQSEAAFNKMRDAWSVVKPRGFAYGDSHSTSSGGGGSRNSRSQTRSSKSQSPSPSRQSSPRQASYDEFPVSLQAASTLANPFASAARNASDGANVAASAAAPIAERLYRNAAHAARYRDKLKADADTRLERELEQTRFRVNSESRRLCESKRSTTQAPDILSRLYSEGLKELAEKKKLPEQAPSYIEDWSCASCGTFHTMRYTFDGLALENGHTHDKRKCSTCGFEQAAAATHRPAQLINLHMSQQDSVEMLRRARERQLVREKNKAKGIIERSATEPSFKPSIPAQSKRIVQACIDREKGQGALLEDVDAPSASGKDKSKSKTASSATTTTTTTTVAAVAAAIGVAAATEVPIDQYFKEDIYSRLRANKKPTIRRTTYLPLSHAELMGEERIALSEPEPTTDRRDPLDLVRFIDRLTYEYKEKDARRAEWYRGPQRDPVTGATLFQPTIPSQRGSYGQTLHEGVGGPQVYKRYMREKSGGLPVHKRQLIEQQAQQLAQQQALQEQQELLNQPKALPRSEQILEEASAKAIEVMFRVLLAGTLMPEPAALNGHAHVQAQSHADEATATATTTLPSGVKLLLQHDHEDWQHQRLNLARVRLEMLVPDLVDFVGAVKAELSKVNAALPLASPSTDSSNEAVSFDLFSKLVRRVLHQGAATRLQWRRAFIVTPHSRRAGDHEQHNHHHQGQPQQQHEADSNDDSCTFTPQLAPHTEALAQAKNRPTGVAGAVHEHLFEQAVKLKRRHDEAQAAHQSAEADRGITHPHMYPAPRNVQPRYRHVGMGPPAAEACSKGSVTVLFNKPSTAAGTAGQGTSKVAPALQQQQQQPRPQNLPLPPPRAAPAVDGKGRALPPPLPCEVRIEADPAARALFTTPQ